MAVRTALAVAPRPARGRTEEKDPYRGLRPSKLRHLRDRLTKQGRVAEALAAARRLAEIAPGRESVFRLGVLVRDSGRHRESIKIFRDALRFEKGPKHLLPEIHIHTASAWFSLGNKKRMGEALRRAYSMNLKPRTLPDFHLVLGTHYFAKNQFREALAEYKRSERVSQNRQHTVRSLLNQGLVLIKLGLLDEAGFPLDRAIRLSAAGRMRSQLYGARAVRAILHFDLGDLDKALAMVLRVADGWKAIGRKDQEALALQNAGYVAGELGKVDLAHGCLDRSIRIARMSERWQTLIRAHASRAWVHFRNECFAEGDRDLLEACRLMRGRRYPMGDMFISRTKARLAGLFANWDEMKKFARLGERGSKRINDNLRIAEFRKLRAVAESALGRRRAAHDARKKAGRLEGVLLARGPIQSRLDARIRRLAPTSIRVLVVGEDGTGKLEVVREIHAKSDRARRRCVVVACEQVTFPEVEFGGAKAGAWTGATGRIRGAFERAGRGTLILDRVDALDAQSQAVLLRMVEGHVRPVGGDSEVAHDARILATCMNEDAIRPDLRERLAGARIVVSPLRDRRDQMPWIVEQLLAGRRPITVDAVALLAEHPWQGNLVELRAVIERVLALTEGPVGVNAIRRILKTPDLGRLGRRVHNLRKVAKPALAAL